MGPHQGHTVRLTTTSGSGRSAPRSQSLVRPHSRTNAGTVAGATEGRRISSAQPPEERTVDAGAEMFSAPSGWLCRVIGTILDSAALRQDDHAGCVAVARSSLHSMLARRYSPRLPVGIASPSERSRTPLRSPRMTMPDVPPSHARHCTRRWRGDVLRAFRVALHRHRNDPGLRCAPPG
jgi:hypothetical protein